MPNGRSSKGNRRWLQDEIEWGIELAGYYDVPILDDDRWDEEWQDDGAEETGELRQQLMGRLRRCIPEGADHDRLVRGSTEDDLRDVLAMAGRLADEIAGAGWERLNTIGTDIGGVEDRVSSVHETVDRRRVEKQRIIGEAGEFGLPEGATEAEISDFGDAVDAVAGALDVAPLTDTALDLGRAARRLLPGLVEVIDKAIGVRKEEHTRIRDAADQITQQGFLPDQIKRLTDARDDLAAALEPPITDERNSIAEDALKTLADLAQGVRVEIENLGGTEQIGLFCKEAGVDLDVYLAMEEHLGGRVDMAKMLRVFPAAELGQLCNTFGIGASGAEAFGNIVTAFGDAGALKATMTALGGKDKLVALIKRGGLEAGAVKTLCEDLGGPFVGAMMGAGNDPKDILALKVQLGASVKPLQDLTREGGFAGNPQALVALFADGCGGDPATFETFCASFDTSEDRERLKGLIEDGGLGAAPQALGALFATGCDGDPAALKALGNAFDDDGKRADLARLLDAGGLAGAGEVDPNCLGQLLKLGAGDAADAGARAQALQKLAAGLDEPACKNLAKSLTDGGLGKEPEVFGHLAGIGCDKSDAAKFTALVNELGSDAGKLKGLDDLLNKGGFGTLDGADTATGTDARCLANLFLPGCEGKPGELTKLLTSLGGNDFANLKGVMTDGALGVYPEVIGQLYKHGCITDPDGASNGAKNPQVLKDMIGEFGGPHGPGQFRDLLVNGGFAAPGKEARLGSMMRYAFAPKNPPGGAQDGKKLKQLHSAFNGHMGDLVTTMEAMETAPAHVLEPSAPGEPNQPGKGLRNVVNAPGHGGNATQLRRKFFNNINARIGGPTPRGGVPNLGLNDLLATAASFEHVDVTQNSVEVQAPGASHSGTDFDMGHAAGRHTRRHNKVQNSRGSPTAPTTLYPRDITETELAQLVKDSLAHTAAAGRNASGYFRNRGKNDPPRTPGDLNHPSTHDTGRFTRYRNVSNGGTESSRLGFNRGRNGRLAITQFFPESGANLVKVNHRDMTAMRRALH